MFLLYISRGGPFPQKDPPRAPPQKLFGKLFDWCKPKQGEQSKKASFHRRTLSQKRLPQCLPKKLEGCYGWLREWKARWVGVTGNAKQKNVLFDKIVSHFASLSLFQSARARKKSEKFLGWGFGEGAFFKKTLPVKLILFFGFSAGSGELPQEKLELGLAEAAAAKRELA